MKKVKLTGLEVRRLIDEALRGLEKAFAIVSNFRVGAAVLTANGTMYKGCNIEDVISGMGICAERCAMYNAVSNGHYLFNAIAVVAETEKYIEPCGVCRQAIFEFSQIDDIDTLILKARSDGSYVTTSISKIMPTSFGPRDLNKDLNKYRR